MHVSFGAMDQESGKSTSKRASFRRWFKNIRKGTDASLHLNESSDEDEENEDRQDDVFTKSMKNEHCVSTSELRIFVGTWNVAGRSPVGSLAEDLDEWLNRKYNAADIYVLGFQEVVPLKTRNVLGAEDPTEATKWNLLVEETLNKKESPWLTPAMTTRHSISNDNRNHIQHSYIERRKSVCITDQIPLREIKVLDEQKNGSSKYVLMASRKMVGVFLSVWMKEDLLKKYRVSTVRVSSVACGIMGYLGNKGSVSVSMSIEGTSFCFIAAHLASGEKKGDEGRRNHQVSEIFRRTTFPRVPQDHDDYNPHPQTILGHDQIFWCGDLNYRLYLEDGFARKLIKNEDWRALQVFDQLQKEQEHGGVFQGWKEGIIEFAPTYKYSVTNCNRYSGGPLSKSGEKRRTPAWCDRILWYGKGVKQLSYYRSEIKFSDHRPVSALFATQIQVNSDTKSKVHPVHFPTVPPSQVEQKGIERSKSPLLSLIEEDKDS